VDARAGAWAVLLVVTMPGAAVAGTTPSPDSPLHVGWLVSLVTLWRAFAVARDTADTAPAPAAATSAAATSRRSRSSRGTLIL
jgi:4-amino-4-deoxy-L-arabinose transferase-like glycosyltransferase